MMEWPKFKASPWTLCCMFPSPSPAAIPLLESCTISRAKVGLANLPSSNPTLVITFSLANQNRRICYLLTPFLSCSHSHFNDVFSSERATIVQFWKSEAPWFSHYKAQQKNKTGVKDFTFFIFPLLCSYPNDSKIGTFLWFSQQFSLTYIQGGDASFACPSCSSEPHELRKMDLFPQLTVGESLSTM